MKKYKLLRIILFLSFGLIACAQTCVDYYEFDSCLSNKYADYGLKLPQKCDVLHVTSANDDIWVIAA